jgi:glycosyltransferase involved in cell wall biosynthesis
VSAAPLVSVVIPTFDRAHCVTEAMGSVLAQTHRAIECLVVDDGSRDDTLAVLDAAFADDPRVRVLARDHAGVSAARNHGIAQATGEYVTFLDSDDLMLEHRVEHQLDHLFATGAGAVICRGRHVLVGDAPAPGWLQRNPDGSEAWHHSAVLVPTACVRAIGGFDEQLTIGEDFDLVVRLVATGVTVETLDEVLVVSRIFGDNATYAIDDDFHDLLRVVRRHLAHDRPSGEQLGRPRNRP